MGATAPQYFVRVGRQVRGPCDLARLQALAASREITPDTEVAASADGPWSLLITLPERGAIFSERILLATKPTFEPTPDSPIPVKLQDVIEDAATPGRVLRSRQELDAEVYRPAKPRPPENEVQAMVQSVQAREAEFAPPPPPAPKRKMSRRFKFIAMLALAGNAALVAIPIGYHALGDEWSMLVIRGWFLIYNGGLVIAYCTLPKE